MKKFLVLYHATQEAMEFMKTESEEDQAKEMEKWVSWINKNAENLVDEGNPVAGNHTMHTSGNKEDANDILGYCIMQGETKENVMNLLEDQPHLLWHNGATISVMEILPM